MSLSPWPSNLSAWGRPGSGFSVALDDDGLRLGSARLARMIGPRTARRLDLASDRERAIALISVAEGHSVSADVLVHLESASLFWERGDKALANFRLVFAKLPRLDEPADAARVALAGICLDEGLTPRALMKELGLDTATLDVIKYDSNQPRVPAGSGAESGRWTSGSASRSLVAPLPSLLAETTPETIAALAEFAAKFSVPIAVLGALIIPTPNSGGVTTGVLPDASDVSFEKDDPAGTLRLTTKAPDGSDITVFARNERGIYVNVDTGKALGRDLGGQLYLDFDAVQDAIDDASPQNAGGEPDARSKAATEEPRLCPAPAPDTPHGASDRARDYEDDIHARVNPIAPMPRGFGVKVLNPVTGEDVFFDDCFRYAGDLIDGDMKPGDLVEAKGQRLEFLYSQSWAGTMNEDLIQAKKQLDAANARGVGLKWYYAEKGAADAARRAFGGSELRRIVIGVMPPRQRP